MLHWYLFFFIAVGAKLILAAAMIYLLLPTDRRCSQCDEETILIRPHGIGRVGSWLSLGWVQWRWWPRCGWEGMTRRRREPNPRAGSGSPSTPTAPTPLNRGPR